MSGIEPVHRGGEASSIGEHARFGVVTISDRASSGTYEDLSGPAIIQFFREAIKSPWEALYRCIPDEQALIEEALRKLVDDEGCCFVVTTGGTGPAKRDVTPEATEATAGLRGQALILNLPGSPKAIRETIDEVFQSIPACIQLLEGPYIETLEAVVKAFRPKYLIRQPQ